MNGTQGLPLEDIRAAAVEARRQGTRPITGAAQVPDGSIFGVPIIITPLLPMAPSPTEDTIRQVRHGLADVLKWLGEDVGPPPGAKTHGILSVDVASRPTYFVSQAHYDQLKAEATYAC